MLDDLLDTLMPALPEISAEDVADILWLAPYLPLGSTPKARVPRPRRDEQPATEHDQLTRRADRRAAPDKPNGTLQTGSTPKEGPPAEGKPGSERAGGGLYVQPGAERGAPDDLPFRTPEAPALPGRLKLARALRPLIAQVDDEVRYIFDEEATVRRIAETDIWIPVRRPSPRPRFEVALVLDASPTMNIWRRTVSELHTMFSLHRAFADSRIWELHVASRVVTLRSGLGNDGGAQLSWPGPLRDPQGRRLVMLVSDCVGKPWQDGTLAEALAALAAQTRVVLLQVLLAHLWLRTALGDALTTTVSAGADGWPKDSAPPDRFGDAIPYSPPIPVTTLEPARLEAWAALTSGHAGARTTAVMLDTTPTATPPAPERSAAERVNSFIAGASPTSRRLAGLLASASPLNLHIARLIQTSMLPDSRQTHLAEVFLGGLLYRDPQNDPRSHPDDVRYEFYPEVRRLLRGAVPIVDAIAVLRTVSEYISGQRGVGKDFFAFLDELLTTAPEGHHQVQPFATVAAEVLAGLGGRYAALAGRLSTVASSAVTPRPRPGRTAVQEQAPAASPVIEPPPPPRPLIYEGRPLIPLERVSAIGPEVRKKLGAYWITTVEEFVSTARAGNASHGSGLAALALALEMSEDELTGLLQAAQVLLPPEDLSF